jgi:uncharacterized protein involved in exopolysaccharide biosynthesis
MENSLSLRDTIELLLRQRILVGAVSLCTVVLATAVALFQTPIYQSTAVLLIKFGREMISRPEVGDRETLVSRESAIINVEIQILRSESVIDGAIQSLTVERLYPELFEDPPETVPIERIAANRFRRNFIVSAVPASDVIKLSFRHPDPELAAETVNVLVEQFKKKHLETFSGKEASAFLDEKVESYRAALENVEEQVRKFRTVHAAFSVEDPGALLMDQRTRLAGDLEQTTEQISEIRRRLATPTPVDTAQKIGDRTELHSQVREQRRLAADLRKTEAELEDLAALQKEYRVLVRGRDETEELYRTYYKKLADARISNEMDVKRIAAISVIQNGLVPITPIRPKRRLYVVVGATAGVVLGCLAAFLVDALGRAPVRKRLRAEQFLDQA